MKKKDEEKSPFVKGFGEVQDVPKDVSINTLGDNFYDALEHVTLGGKITKKEWNSPDIYGLLEEGRLRIHKSDGKTFDWILSDGDILGMDWIMLSTPKV